MLNQSFTADNFETIYDIENRKNNIKAYLGEKYSGILVQIKELQNEITQIKRKKLNDRTNEENENLIEYKRIIENIKLSMPQKYLPKAEFLEWHRDVIFEK
jgi:hypothetical protein